MSGVYTAVQETKIDWWRADSHWSQCQLYFSRQFHFIITFHERVFNMPSIWWCNFINLHICLFTKRVILCRQSGVATFIHMHYSRTSAFIAVNQNYRMLYHLSHLILETSVAYAVNQNYQSQLSAPSMPNMTPTSTSEGQKRSFIFSIITILRIS